MGIEEMRSRGVNAETVVWKAGMADWTKAVNVPELMSQLQPVQQPVQQNPYQQPVQQQYQQQNPYQQPVQQQYQQQNPYQQPVQQQYPQQNPYQQQQNPYQQNPYQQPGYEAPHTNWMPWAIVGTVLGLCSFIGLVLGIIAIVKANNANKLYQQGASMEAEPINNSAKTFAIVSLCFDALGILGSLIMIASA